MILLFNSAVSNNVMQKTNLVSQILINLNSSRVGVLDKLHKEEGNIKGESYSNTLGIDKPLLLLLDYMTLTMAIRQLF